MCWADNQILSSHNERNSHSHGISYLTIQSLFFALTSNSALGGTGTFRFELLGMLVRLTYFNLSGFVDSKDCFAFSASKTTWFFSS